MVKITKREMYEIVEAAYMDRLFVNAGITEGSKVYVTVYYSNSGAIEFCYDAWDKNEAVTVEPVKPIMVYGEDPDYKKFAEVYDNVLKNGFLTKEANERVQEVSAKIKDIAESTSKKLEKMDREAAEKAAEAVEDSGADKE